MIINLIAYNLTIQFKLISVILHSTTYGNQYKFSVAFLSNHGHEVLSLPVNYHTYLNTDDIVFLIKFISNAKQEIIQKADTDEFYMNFQSRTYFNLEFDIKIEIQSGEYFREEQDEDDGRLNFNFFFNVNQAYNEPGSCMVGIKTFVYFEELQAFSYDLQTMLDSPVEVRERHL